MPVPFGAPTGQGDRLKVGDVGQPPLEPVTFQGWGGPYISSELGKGQAVDAFAQASDSRFRSFAIEPARLESVQVCPLTVEVNREGEKEETRPNILESGSFWEDRFRLKFTSKTSQSASLKPNDSGEGTVRFEVAYQKPDSSRPGKVAIKIIHYADAADSARRAYEASPGKKLPWDGLFSIGQDRKAELTENQKIWFLQRDTQYYLGLVARRASNPIAAITRALAEGCTDNEEIRALLEQATQDFETGNLEVIFDPSPSVSPPSSTRTGPPRRRTPSARRRR